jgi:K+-transporting ATPase KdpF subunit
MTPWETVLGATSALLLGIYLIYSLLRPEKF